MNAILTFAETQCVSHTRRISWAVILLLLAVPGVGCSASVDRTSMDATNLPALPQEVRDALDRAIRTYAHPLDGAKWEKVHMLGGTDHPLYQIRGKNSRGNVIELEVTAAGRVIEVEEHGLSLGEVPAPVTEALKSRMPQAEPARVEAIYQAGQVKPVCYGFEGKNSEGKDIEVYISADGKTFLN